MYREMSGIFDGDLLEQKNVTIRTIDAMVSEAGLHNCRFHLVKLDVQGAEIEALKGATKTLKHAAVEICIVR